MREAKKSADPRVTQMLADRAALGRIIDHVATTRTAECQEALVRLMKDGSGAELRALLVSGAEAIVEDQDSDAEFGGEYLRPPLTETRLDFLRSAGVV